MPISLTAFEQNGEVIINVTGFETREEAEAWLEASGSEDETVFDFVCLPTEDTDDKMVAALEAIGALSAVSDFDDGSICKALELLLQEACKMGQKSREAGLIA